MNTSETENAIDGMLIDDLDALSENTAKLEALLTMTCGQAFDDFRNMNDRLMNDYLWACSGFAREAHRVACKLALRGPTPSTSEAKHL
jgi:hypothetical protein